MLSLLLLVAVGSKPLDADFSADCVCTVCSYFPLIGHIQHDDQARKNKSVDTESIGRRRPGELHGGNEGCYGFGMGNDTEVVGEIL